MKEIDFTTGKILPKLIRFALPILAALLLQAMYGAVDLKIVGEYSSTADLSAVSIASQIMHTITGILVGLSTGVSVIVAKKIGEARPDDAGKVIGAGIVLFGIVAVIATAVFVLTARPIADLMLTPEEAFESTVSYLKICSGGIVFILAFNVLGGVFRGIGDSKMPLITVAIACVVNILGDLLLVKTFNMGAAGAAYATVFAQAVSVFLSLIIIRRRKLPFEFSRRDIRFDPVINREILKLGVPIALQDMLVSLSFLVITAIINDLGLIKSAGVGVAEKLCAFVMLIPSAYSQSMAAVVGQNIGAMRPDRARKALWCGIGTSLCAGVIIGYFSFFHGDILAGIFSDDEAVIVQAASYLKSYAIDCLFTSFLFCFIGYFCGLGSTVFVMIQGLVGAFCVRIPVSYFVSRIPDVELFYIGLATPSSTIVQIALCLVYFVVVNRKFRKTDIQSIN